MARLFRQHAPWCFGSTFFRPEPPSWLLEVAEYLACSPITHALDNLQLACLHPSCCVNLSYLTQSEARPQHGSLKIRTKLYATVPATASGMCLIIGALPLAAEQEVRASCSTRSTDIPAACSHYLDLRLHIHIAWGMQGYAHTYSLASAWLLSSLLLKSRNLFEKPQSKRATCFSELRPRSAGLRLRACPGAPRVWGQGCPPRSRDAFCGRPITLAPPTFARVFLTEYPSGAKTMPPPDPATVLPQKVDHA